ncbi:MAG: NADH-quinone oxidoreductase subunit NuoE [Deltaproteobacteria bacterium]|nr:MAG: NADH-quinone oxidoreductase subunit NuoE [Deltaproteobacteria bacterium]
MLDEEDEVFKEVLSSFPARRRYLIRILQTVQHKLGYLPEEGMEKVAQHVGISEAEIFGVATFYNQFRFVPLGKYHIVVCMGTACHTMGGQLILDGFERELEVKVGGVTPDRQYSLERVGCIGCCTKAPVVVINGVIYPKMTPYKVTEVLAALRDKDTEVSEEAQ